MATSFLIVYQIILDKHRKKYIMVICHSERRSLKINFQTKLV